MNQLSPTNETQTVAKRGREQSALEVYTASLAQAVRQNTTQTESQSHRLSSEQLASISSSLATHYQADLSDPQTALLFSPANVLNFIHVDAEGNTLLALPNSQPQVLTHPPPCRARRGSDGGRDRVMRRRGCRPPRRVTSACASRSGRDRRPSRSRTRPQGQLPTPLLRPHVFKPRWPPLLPASPMPPRPLRSTSSRPTTAVPPPPPPPPTVQPADAPAQPPSPIYSPEQPLTPPAAETATAPVEATCVSESTLPGSPPPSVPVSLEPVVPSGFIAPVDAASAMMAHPSDAGMPSVATTFGLLEAAQAASLSGDSSATLAATAAAMAAHGISLAPVAPPASAPTTAVQVPGGLSQEQLLELLRKAPTVDASTARYRIPRIEPSSAAPPVVLQQPAFAAVAAVSAGPPVAAATASPAVAPAVAPAGGAVLVNEAHPAVRLMMEDGLTAEEAIAIVNESMDEDATGLFSMAPLARLCARERPGFRHQDL